MRGRPKGVGVTPPEVRFWRFVAECGACWVWVGGASPDGRGWFRSSPETRTRPYRWAFEHFTRPLVDGETIDHLCANPTCVRPDHLEAVSMAENSRRAAARQVQRRGGYCKNGHNLAVVGTYATGHGDGRRCRACQRASQARTNARVLRSLVALGVHTWRTYEAGCRCDECRVDWNQHCREVRERRLLRTAA